MKTTTAGELMRDAGGSLQDAIAPPEMHEDLSNNIAHIRKHLPREHHHVLDKVIDGGCSITAKTFAAATAAILVREELQPNSATTFLPLGWTAGHTYAPGTAVPMVPYISGVAQEQFTFVRGQRFFGIVTGKADAASGWFVASGTLKFATDAISGINEGDVSFAIFDEDMVGSRMILGEYTRHLIIESIPFTVSCVPYSSAAIVMTEGLTVQYWDKRCMNAEILNQFFTVNGLGSFESLVTELVDMAGAGHPARRLVERIRRHRMAR